MTIEEYYNAIAPKLTSYLVGVGTDYHAACDIVQETFLRLWKKRDELMDDPAQVSGYVYTIARHLRADRLRRQSRETLQEEITDEDAGAVMPSDTSATDAAYLRRRLNDALAQLPPLVREAFSLFQISELSVREIARITGATENLVKVRVHRAKVKLRELLADVA